MMSNFLGHPVYIYIYMYASLSKAKKTIVEFLRCLMTVLAQALLITSTDGIDNVTNHFICHYEEAKLGTSTRKRCIFIVL